MKRLGLLLFTAVFGGLLGASILLPQPASAAFNANTLIADSVFTNAGAMNAGQIDAFLNSQPNSCLSSNANANGNPGFRTPNPQGWSSSQNSYQYGGFVTAGQAIASAAALYSVNPQVILTTLQKEQSLVTGNAGCHYNSPDPASATPMTDQCGSGTRNCTLACVYAGGCVNIAMGYACPLYCNVVNEGFSQQITLGTWLLRFGQQRAYGILNGYQGYEAGDEVFCYAGPMVAGTRVRSSSSNTGCAGRTPTYYDGLYTPQDSAAIGIANGATASLYNFTPFINGNKSFVRTFEGWFGSTNPDTAVTITGAPASVSWGSGRIDTFARGKDGYLWQKWFGSTGGWRDWGRLNAQIASAPTVSSWSEDRLDIFFAGGGGDLQHYWYDGTAWRGIESLGQPAPGVTIVDAPSAISWDSGRIDVFARGSDGALWQKWFDAAGGWRGWHRFNIAVNSTPTVSSWSANRLDVFAMGPNSNLWHLWFDGSGWRGPEYLGTTDRGVSLTAPGAISWDSGRIDVFARGSDGALWQKWFDAAGGWRPWGSLGDDTLSAPTVSSWAPGRLDVFTTGPYGDLKHTWFDNGWSVQETLGRPVN